MFHRELRGLGQVSHRVADVSILTVFREQRACVFLSVWALSGFENNNNTHFRD